MPVGRPGGGLGAPSAARMAKLKKEEKHTKVSRSGKTRKQHLAELIEKVKKAGGPDLAEEGWRCELRPSTKAAASDNGNDNNELDPVYLDSEGNEFFGRKEVLKHLGLKKSEPPPLTRKEAADRARSFCKESLNSNPLPLKLGPLTVRSLGKIEYTRDTFHSSRYIWPIGFKSTWKAEESDVLYESEVLDGAAVGDVGGMGDIDGPIFMVTVKKPGEAARDCFGRSAKEAWRKAVENEKAEERFGFREHEVRRRVEGLRHAFDCHNYDFLELRDQGGGREGRGKEGKGKEGKKGGAGAKGGRKDAGPKKETKAEERARLLKAKQEEAKRVKEEAAAQKRAAAEEAARKKRAEKQLQEQELKWQSRYPIEDLAVELEGIAMAAAQEAGHEVPAQRTAARAVVEAVERGLGRSAALEVAEGAAKRVTEGESVEDALEAAKEEAEERVQKLVEAGADEKMEVEEEGAPVRDANRCHHPGARVRMLFQQDGREQWFQGFIHSVEQEKKTMQIGFYDGEKQEAPLTDADVELLDQGSLALPAPVYSCTRVHPRAGEVMGILSFVDTFKSEPFGLPKCTLHDLMEGFAAPAGSQLVGDLYVALLALALQAAQQQGLSVPPAWLADSTLNHNTWPELARRWFVCGPTKQHLRRWYPEAVAAAHTLPNAACGAATVPEGHVMLVTCLIDDALDHAEIRKCIDNRLETSDELRRTLVQKNKEFAEEEKQRAKSKAAAPVANGNGAVEEEEGMEEPELDLPQELLDRAEEEEAAQREVQERQEAYERLRGAWEKKRQSRARAEERKREEAEKDERRFYERHEKLEADTQAKLDKHLIRHAPLGLDRHHNKYWWFGADKGCVYVEPPLPGSTPAGAPAGEWRILRGEEEVGIVQGALREEKGARETELAKGLRKARERMAGMAGTLNPRLYGGGEHAKQGLYQAEIEALGAAQQEAKNVAEVLEEEQKRALEEAHPGWEEAVLRTLDCEELSRLLLSLEHAITVTIAPTKRIRNQHHALLHPTHAAANPAEPAAPAAPAAEQEAAAVGGNGVADGAAGGEAGKLTAAQWLTEGSEFVGMKTRRLVKGDDGKPAGHANGRIVGWLPAEISDFVCKETGQAAALWRVEFDDEDIGEEDLELHEVEAAVAAYHALSAALSSSSRPVLKKEESADGMQMGGYELGLADEGVVDMVEVHNKATKRSLWTSSLQREAWRTEVGQAGQVKSLPRLCYAAAVLCDNTLRVFSRSRDQLSSAPRRTRPKRTRTEVDTSLLLGITESGRKVRKISYAEDSDVDFDDD